MQQWNKERNKGKIGEQLILNWFINWPVQYRDKYLLFLALDANYRAGNISQSRVVSNSNIFHPQTKRTFLFSLLCRLVVETNVERHNIGSSLALIFHWLGARTVTSKEMFKRARSTKTDLGISSYFIKKISIFKSGFFSLIPSGQGDHK